jgi:RHS repeat-associated protein
MMDDFAEAIRRERLAVLPPCYCDRQPAFSAYCDLEAIPIYLTDRLGSVRNLANASGSLIDTITYDGFGNVTNETNTMVADRWKFTGRELDGETGLQFNRARYLDQKTGRWTSQDPLGFEGGERWKKGPHDGSSTTRALWRKGRLFFERDDSAWIVQPKLDGVLALLLNGQRDSMSGKSGLCDELRAICRWRM